MSDRTVNRLIVGLLAVLLVGIPAIGIIYFIDRHADAGPSMLERSITTGEDAVRTEPNKLSSRMSLASAYAAASRHSDAIVQYGEVLRLEPDNRIALLGRGDEYVALTQLDDATADYQHVVDVTSSGEMAKVDPQLEAAYYALGSIALKQDRARDAAALLANAIKIDKTDADALNLMGTALIKIGDDKNAVAALRDAVSFVPSGWCEPYAQMVQAYTGLKDADGTQYANGMVAVCEKRPADAERELQPLTTGTYASDAMIGLGLAAEDRADRATAISYYSRVYAADPSNFAAVTGLNRLGAGGPGESPIPSAAPGAAVAPGASGAPNATQAPAAASPAPSAPAGGY